MERDKNSNQRQPSHPFYQTSNPTDEDEDLLEDEDSHEIEDYLRGSDPFSSQHANYSLGNLPPSQEMLNRFANFQEYRLQEDLHEDSKGLEHIEQNDEENFEFDNYLYGSRPQTPHAQVQSPDQKLTLNSDRSNCSQISYSPPESQRDDPAFQTVKHNPRADDDGIIYRQPTLSKESQSMLDTGADEKVYFNMNQSPSQGSIAKDFRAQMTSNFQQNFQEFSPNQIGRQFMSEEEEEDKSNDQSDVESQRFNNSFAKYGSQKIKEFEKSTIIRFEEFDGGDSQQEDSFRKFSGRISDRIYEREYQRPSPNADIDNDEEILLTHEMQQQLSSSKKERQLYIITEEDVSDMQSSFQAINRMQTNDSQFKRQGSSEAFIRFNSDQSANVFTIVPQSTQGATLTYQKSKSQPLRKGDSNQGLKRLTQGSKDEYINNALKTESSPKKKKKHLSPNTHEFKSMQSDHFQSLQRNSNSNESPRQHHSEHDQVSQYFKQVCHQKSNHINVTQPEFIMSDEDLLSNIDKVSRILPTNEISDDETKPFHNDEENLNYKIKDQKQLIEHLKCENQNFQTLIMIKESQINLLQVKNDEFQDKIQQLKNELQLAHNGKTMIDQETQCIEIQQSERKKIRPKKSKLSNSVLKKTPQRFGSEFQESSVNNTISSNISKHNSSSNVYDTPQIKFDRILKDSPSPTTKLNLGSLQKQNSISFNSDDINQFKQQIALIKQQLQKSEENNINMEKKIEKLKSDKKSQKESIFQLQLEKSEIAQLCERFKRDLETLQRENQGLMIETRDYVRQISVLEMRLNVQKQDCEVPAMPLPFLIENGIQTDFNYNHFPKEKLLQEAAKIKEDKHNSSLSSLQSLPQQNHITIINNKQDLRQLLDQAKNYELMSRQLQNEINEHRKILKENQDKALKDAQEQKDQKRRIKKRDHKIAKLKLELQRLEKDNIELSIKLDQTQQKATKAKMRLEQKLQEKDLKIIGLKNQIRNIQIPTSSGFITPINSNQNASFMNQKVYTQNELFSMISQILKQHSQNNNEGLIDQAALDTIIKQRPKSQDIAGQKPIQVSAFEGIMSPGYFKPTNFSQYGQQAMFSNQSNQINQSFSQNEQNNTFSGVKSNLNNYLQYNSQFPRSQINNLIQRNDSKEDIQMIFSSSIKRISQELENIKNMNQRAIPLRQKKPRIYPKNNPVKRSETTTIIYEDSLQTQPNEKEYKSHYINQDFAGQMMLDQNNQRKQSDSLEKLNERQKIASSLSQQRKVSSMQNTHTFRKIPMQGGTPNNSNKQKNFNFGNIFPFNESTKFNNTGKYHQEKQQITSFLDDFRPAFENSNLNHSLNQSNGRPQEESKHHSMKFETQAASLNNSKGGYHVRLNSNLITKEVDETPKSSIEDRQTKNQPLIDELERNYRSEQIDEKKEMRPLPNSSILEQYGPRPKLNSNTNCSQNKILDHGRNEGTASSLSNQSHKLEDLKKRYGRLN